MVKVICIVGYTGSGKTSIAQGLKDENEVSHIIEVSDIIKKYSADGTDVKNSSIIRDELIKSVNNKEGNIIISGIREIDLLDKVREEFKNITVIKLESSEYQRLQRFIKRPGKSKFDFVKKDLDERQIGLSKLMACADGIYVESDGDLKDVIASVIEVI